jgi:PAS domain S-box-containing protein
MAEDDSCPDPVITAAMAGVSAIFASLGRVLICLDASLRVVHTSEALREFLGTAADDLVGRPVSDVLGEELFGEAGTLREALLRGERREGWRSMLRRGDGSMRLVSVTAAPFLHAVQDPCDPRVVYLLVVRPAEDDQLGGTAAPTVFSGMIARSGAMEQIFTLVQNLESSDATILLTGESGTGKEVLAKAIHEHSPRRKGPFIAVNCAGLPGELLESELFGHVRGSFTGAVRDRIGRFELAARGTLFLDEIGDLPLHLQVKLLRVLQERTFERVGESQTRTADARIIAATHVDLRRAASEGRFREDLYYRLRVVPIEIPPLRTRREDIEPLARYLLARVGARHARELRFSPEAIRSLLHYPWPGNVRELENAIEYAVAVCKGQTLHAEDLPLEVLDAPHAIREDARPRDSSVPLPAVELAEASREAELIRSALASHQWRRDGAARSLGMSRTTLWRKMREYGLVPR